jgi:hypothetical protein
VLADVMLGAVARLRDGRGCGAAGAGPGWAIASREGESIRRGAGVGAAVTRCGGLRRGLAGAAAGADAGGGGFGVVVEPFSRIAALRASSAAADRSRCVSTGVTLALAHVSNLVGEANGSLPQKPSIGSGGS